MTARERLRRAYLEMIGRPVVQPKPLPRHLKLLQRLLQAYQVTVVLDVGANAGQYGRTLRNIGYNGRIVSFEPLSEAYLRLKEARGKDSKWELHQYGLGDIDGMAEINVAGNSFSSSFLPMLPVHAEAAPKSAYVGREKVALHRLDSVFGEICRPGDSVFLKIDTQGYESRVLSGACASLAAIPTIQIELSVIPLYEGESTYEYYFEWFRTRDFRLVWLNSGFWNPSNGEMLQFDAIFRRMNSSPL